MGTVEPETNKLIIKTTCLVMLSDTAVFVIFDSFFFYICACGVNPLMAFKFQQLSNTEGDLNL